MSTPNCIREAVGSTVRLRASSCEFVLDRPRPGVLVIAVRGFDSGQLGTAVLDEITHALTREPPLHVFIDAREAEGVVARVREDWTQFLASNRASLASVHVLTGSKVVQLAVEVAQLFSRTGSLVRLYSSADAFTARLQSVQAGVRTPVQSPVN